MIRSVPAQVSRTTSLLALALLAVAACDRGSPSIPTAPASPAAPSSPSDPEVFVPTLPSTEAATAGVYDRAEPPDTWQTSRLVVDVDGSFRLEYLEPGGAVRGVVSGLYSRSGSWYLLQVADSNWVAMASFDGSCVEIQFNLWALLSDFENGKYCRANTATRQAWSGFWSFESAEPVGDCLADAMNEWHGRGGMIEMPLDLRVERDGDEGVLLVFSLFTQGDSTGFWPTRFRGAVSADGTIRGTPDVAPGSQRTDPWLELCYGSWTSEGGELSASLSADGRSLTGRVIETFRTVQPEGFVFTVRSQFATTLR